VETLHEEIRLRLGRKRVIKEKCPRNGTHEWGSLHWGKRKHTEGEVQRGEHLVVAKKFRKKEKNRRRIRLFPEGWGESHYQSKLFMRRATHGGVCEGPLSGLETLTILMHEREGNLRKKEATKGEGISIGRFGVSGKGFILGACFLPRRRGSPKQITCRHLATGNFERKKKLALESKTHQSTGPCVGAFFGG